MKYLKWITNAGIGLAMLVCLCLLFPVQAYCQGADRLVDEAGLLSDAEAQSLNEYLDEVRERQQFDVVVVTVNSLNGKDALLFAGDFYDDNGYGMGADRDGILFLLAMEEREWAISTCGFGITAFTDAGQEYMVEQFRQDLSDGNYYDAFMAYAEQSEDFLIQAKNGEAYDEGHLPVTASDILFCVAMGLMAGFLLALLRVFVMKMQMETVYSQRAAADYLQKDSIRFQEKSDRLVRKAVNKIYIEPKEQSGGSGSSGGSTTYTSSSGQTHGGSSGKF